MLVLSVLTCHELLVLWHITGTMCCVVLTCFAVPCLVVLLLGDVLCCVLVVRCVVQHIADFADSSCAAHW